MFPLLLFLLSLTSWECGAQFYVYSGPFRRAPLGPMEALERLRAPLARYFPQVEYPEEYPQWPEEYGDYGAPEEEEYSQEVAPRMPPVQRRRDPTTQESKKVESGQKEEPLFLHSGQNNGTQKSPIPLLKQMILKDPLLDELSSLKKKP